MSVTFLEFEQQVNETSNGRLKAIRRTHYHWQIHGGAQLVEFWPSKMKIYSSKMTKSRRGTVDEAISLAGIPNNDPVDDPVDDPVFDVPVASQELLAKTTDKLYAPMVGVMLISLLALIIGVVALVLALAT